MVPRNFQDIEGVGLSLIPASHGLSAWSRDNLLYLLHLVPELSGWRKLELETHLAKPFALRHCSRVPVDICVKRGPFFDDDEYLLGTSIT